MNCSLEIVGKLNAHQVETLRKNNIDYTNSSGLTEGELINKYLQADILIFVSTYEGLGVPVLEAQALGIPVVTSNISPMSETSGGAAILVDPYDIDQISRAIYKIIEDDDHRKKMISAGLENVKKYHPKIMANSFEEVYKEIN
jgi:glycosyltransferase involved in cell wall biosynthesis